MDSGDSMWCSDFFRAYHDSTKEFLVEFPGDTGITKGNYGHVVAQPVRLLPEAVLRIEGELGHSIPAHYLEWYCCSYGYAYENSIDLSNGIQLSTARAGSEETGLQKQFFEGYLPDEISFRRLLPIGLYQDEWIICLDLRYGIFADPQVVLFELTAFHNGEEPISPLHWFSSFSLFIKCMTAELNGGDEAALLRIDPNHHYRSAYPYWQQH